MTFVVRRVPRTELEVASYGGVESYWAAIVSTTVQHEHSHVWGPRAAAARFSTEGDARFVARAVTLYDEPNVEAVVEAWCDDEPSTLVEEAALVRYVNALDAMSVWRGHKVKTPMHLDVERELREALAALERLGRSAIKRGLRTTTGQSADDGRSR